MRLKTAVTALVILSSLWLAPGSLSAIEPTSEIAEKAGAVPNDPCIIGCAPYGVPWYLEAIGAYEAWEVTTGSDDVLIAVVDTGIDDQHPDLQGRVHRIPGCGLGQSSSFDTSHGTFIAGLIGPQLIIR